MIEKRTARFRKDEEHERRLKELNGLLSSVEAELVRGFSCPRLPIVFVVGAPRCGSTLLAEILSRTGGLAYVDNFVARFWMAPYLGVMIERVLTTDSDSARPFVSEYGVTEGWRGPHEFGYFWSRWFAFGDTHKLDNMRLAGIDQQGLCRELAGLEHIHGKPLFFKNLTCGLQISFLAELLEKSIFVHCRRDPLYNAQSLLIGREDVHGDREAWFSLKPGKYADLLEFSPYEQVAGQLYYTLADIQEGSQALPANRFLDICYEDLCRRPREEIRRIAEAVTELGGNSCWNMETIPERFEARNVQRVGDVEFKKLDEAILRFSSGSGSGAT